MVNSSSLIRLEFVRISPYVVDDTYKYLRCKLLHAFIHARVIIVSRNQWRNGVGSLREYITLMTANTDAVSADIIIYF